MKESGDSDVSIVCSRRRLGELVFDTRAGSRGVSTRKRGKAPVAEHGVTTRCGRSQGHRPMSPTTCQGYSKCRHPGESLAGGGHIRMKRPRALPQTSCKGRRPVGFAPVATTRRIADDLGRFARSPWGLGQVADAHQVVRRQAEDEHFAHSTSATASGFAQEPDGFEPAEDLFYALRFHWLTS